MKKTGSQTGGVFCGFLAKLYKCSMSIWSCTSASCVLLRTIPAPTCSYKPSQLCSSLATRNYSCLVAARPRLLSRVPTPVRPCCRPLQHSASAVSAAVSEPSVEWRGLPAWRLSDIDNRLVWGDKGPVAWVGSMLTSAQDQKIGDTIWGTFIAERPGQW